MKKKTQATAKGKCEGCGATTKLVSYPVLNPTTGAEERMTFCRPCLRPARTR